MMDDEYFLVETGQKPAPSEGLKSPGMQHWLDLGVGAMLSWGVNTFNNMEWSDGTLSIETVNSENFNPSPLMKSLKAAGIKYVLPITKHIDGFCIWPSSTTDYHSMNSPLKKDVLAEIVNAARTEGLEVGLYFSLWDRREPSFTRDHREFAQIMKRQLTEILSNYGPIIELWVDGAWHKGGVHWPDAELWYWRELYDLIKSLQPECQVGINGTTDRPGEIIMYPCDYRIGEKRSPGDAETKV